MKGKVYKSTGSWYSVKGENGQFFNARLKGVFKIDEYTSTNPIAVGDDVEIEPEKDTEKNAVITGILPRRNYINRQSPRQKNQHHIIAANIDQSVLIATLKEPRTSQGFIDRFLVTCEMYHVPAVIILNKTDLYREKEKTQQALWKDMYEGLGYRLIAASAKLGTGIDLIRELIRNRISLLSGHSGVGKTTLINMISSGLNLKTRDVSGWSGKGMHTTTFAEMFDLPDGSRQDGGQIIDTPGMREFGLVNISRQELSHYFPEMCRLINECQFNNCLHINEPGCAVRKAVEDGQIAAARYTSYCNILGSIEEKKY